MRIDSTKRTTNGIIFGLINKAVVILMPFVLRTILIHKIGDDYAGLSSLFTSILRVLNMAELGFAAAAAFSFYKPVANDDSDKVCALLSFYRTVYRIVGAFVLVAGLSLLPFLDNLINGSYPYDINLRALYFIYLLESASSYFLFSYKNLILNVYQRIDVISIISTLLHLVVYGLQVVVLVWLKDYYLFVVLDLVYTVSNNLFVAAYVSRHFPQYRCRGMIDKDERKENVKNIYGMFLFKVCSATRSSLNTVFISAFIGLKAATIYGNYYLIFAGVASLQAIICDSMKGGIGNKIALKSPEQNHQDMQVLMFLYAWLSGVLTSCLLCLYQPFVELWVGSSLMLNDSEMVLLVVYFYTLSMGTIRFLYHQSAGLFWPKRYWTLAETLTIAILDYFLVGFWGIKGVLIANIFATLTIDFGYSTTIVYDYYFKNKKISMYFQKHVLYFLVTGIGCIVSYFLCMIIPLSGVLGLVTKAIVCIVACNVVYFPIYKKLPEYCDAIRIVFRILKLDEEKVAYRLNSFKD